MKRDTVFRSGQTVTIYGRPEKEQKPEGSAILVRWVRTHPPDRRARQLEEWYVSFTDRPGVWRRAIKRPTRSATRLERSSDA